MKHAPDMQHPLTDEFACELYHATNRSVLEEAVTRPDGGWGPWEQTLPEARAFFRDRAKRFMEGDLSVMPWKAPIGTGQSQGCGVPR